VNWQGKHVSSDSFSAGLLLENSSAFQSVVVVKPKDGTIGADETLGDRERMGTWMLKMLLPGENGSLNNPLSHYVHVIVDGLPGVELAGTVNTHVATVNPDVTAGSRTRFVCAYVIVDQRRNLAYIVAYHLDAPGSGTIGLGFTFTEQAFHFLDSFHIDR